MASGSKAWSALSALSAMVASITAKKVIDGSWRAATGKTPPKNPADPDVRTREAILFAVFSGAIAALTRTVAMRRAANYYTRSTGKTVPSKTGSKKA
jgi:hypothetical protein